MSAMLIALSAGCSSDSDDEGLEEEFVYGIAEKYDPMFKVSYYAEDPGLHQRQVHCLSENSYELIPQKEPPFILLVKWDSDEGKKALDYVINKGDGVVLQKYDMGYENTSIIVCNKYITCPYFYVSSSYKSSDSFLLEHDYIRIDCCILVKMKEGKSVEAIAKEYADLLELDHNGKLAGVYSFNCKSRISYQVLQLAEEIHLRDDVEWAEPNMWVPFHTF